jgi:hypothetical protein
MLRNAMTSVVVKVASATVVGILAGALVTTTPASANVGDTYININSGLCLTEWDTYNGGYNGASVKQGRCGITPDGFLDPNIIGIHWYYQWVGECTNDAYGNHDCWYLVRNRWDGRCLDVAGLSQDNGADVIVWDCWGGPNQQWAIRLEGSFAISLRARHSNKCLDVFAFSQDVGGKVVQWDCWGALNQMWEQW